MHFAYTVAAFKEIVTKRRLVVSCDTLPVKLCLLHRDADLFPHLIPAL